MIVFLVSLVAVAGFAAGLRFTDIVRAARAVVSGANSGLSVMLDSEMSDDQKEAAVRKAGITLILGGWSIAWRVVVCLAAAAAPIYLAQFLGIASADDVFALMLRVDYLIGISAAAILVVWLLGRSTSRREDTAVNSYASGDRFLHMLAFSGPRFQKRMARLEDRLFGKGLAEVTEQAPILVTSLARGGTTAVLNSLASLSGTAVHTYRDMPFVTAPLLWSRFSAPMKRKVEKRKRAHGDGLNIDLDSPEAFDEVYWKMFWPEKYTDRGIETWTAGDRNADATTFLRSMFRKIILLRTGTTGRYLSKNNANIARLRLLPNMFGDYAIVVLVRQPATHAASLLRQHENFLKLQAEDDFVGRYMRDIGHFEFGLLHKPILFDSFDETRFDTHDPNYWLSYWIAAFEEVLHHGAECHLLLHDDLRSDPTRAMTRLCDTLGLAHEGTDFASFFRPGADITDNSVFDPELLAEADQLYAKLAEVATGRPKLPKQPETDATGNMSRTAVTAPKTNLVE